MPARRFDVDESGAGRPPQTGSQSSQGQALAQGTNTMRIHHNSPPQVELKEIELSHEDIIKNMQLEHDKLVTKLREDYERTAKVMWME